MQSFFNEQKKNIEKFLKTYIEKNKEHIKALHFDGLNVLENIYEFSRRGKMIRGGLVALSYMLFNTGTTPSVLEGITKIGAVLELLQSSLLIHDDIMDRDIKRRGEYSFFYNYHEMAKERSLRDPYHIGESLGICGGDIACFLAFDLLSRLKLNTDINREILQLCAREMFYVGVAQMLDVYWGADTTMIDEEAILNLYAYKTGRYTHALPLKIGAIISGIDRPYLDTLQTIGELMGTVFQIVDDDIGLFGNEEEVGKSIGSDLKEGKKILYLCKVYKKAGKKEKEKIRSCIGNNSITMEDIEYIRMLVNQLGVRDELQRQSLEMTNKVFTLVDSLPIVSEKAKDIFHWFIDFNMRRVK
jgi:geranylgeranyl diphosphate synthase type I